MNIGIPKERRPFEFRVGLSPAGVEILTQHRHQIYVEHDAGLLALKAYALQSRTRRRGGLDVNVLRERRSESDFRIGLAALERLPHGATLDETVDIDSFKARQVAIPTSGNANPTHPAHPGNNMGC